jgi:hypothetical protein
LNEARLNTAECDKTCKVCNVAHWEALEARCLLGDFLTDSEAGPITSAPDHRDASARGARSGLDRFTGHRKLKRRLEAAAQPRIEIPFFQPRPDIVAYNHMAHNRIIAALIVGDTEQTILLPQRLLARGIHVRPRVAVAPDACRRRFSLTVGYSEEQIRATLPLVDEELDRLQRDGA